MSRIGGKLSKPSSLEMLQPPPHHPPLDEACESMNERNLPVSKSTSMISRIASIVALVAIATMLLGLPASAKTKPAPKPQVGDVIIAGGIASGGSATASAEFFS